MEIDIDMDVCASVIWNLMCQGTHATDAILQFSSDRIKLANSCRCVVSLVEEEGENKEINESFLGNFGFDDGDTYFAHISAPPFCSSFRSRRRWARIAAASLLVDLSVLAISAECSELDAFRCVCKQ